MRNFIMKRSTQVSAGLALAVVSVMGMSLAAGATTYDPTSALTGLANGATSTAAPIVVALAIALVPLAIVFWAVGWVFGFFGKKRRA